MMKIFSMLSKIYIDSCSTFEYQAVCYELDLGALTIEISQLARQHDLTQNNPLETPCLPLLCCRSESEKVFMSSIQLAF